MPKTTQTPKPEADATLKPFGGLPVHEQDGVAEIDITDGEEQAVVVGTSGEVGARSANTAKDTPTRAQKRPQRATSSKATQTSRRKRKATTSHRNATQTPQKTTPDTKPKSKAKKPDTNLTVGELAVNFEEHLESIGKSRGTVFGYSIEMKTAVKHFGADTKAASLTEKQVREYFESDKVTKNRAGKPKSQLTIDKTRRVFRQALVWLAEEGVVKTAPIPDLKAETKSATKAATKAARKAKTKKPDKSGK